MNWTDIVRHDPHLIASPDNQKGAFVLREAGQGGVPGVAIIGQVRHQWLAIVPLEGGGSGGSFVSLVYTEGHLSSYTAAFVSPEGHEDVHLENDQLVESAPFYRSSDARCCPATQVKTFYELRGDEFFRLKSIAIDNKSGRLSENREMLPGWFRESRDHADATLDLKHTNLAKSDLLGVRRDLQSNKRSPFVDESGTALPNLSPTRVVYDAPDGVIAWSIGFEGAFENGIARADPPPEFIAARDLSRAGTKAGIHLGQSAAEVRRIHPLPQVTNWGPHLSIFSYVTASPCMSILNVVLLDDRVSTIQEVHSCPSGV